MTQTSDMLDCLKRIETILGSIETMLAHILAEPKTSQPPGLNERIRDRLRRLRLNREKADAQP